MMTDKKHLYKVSGHPVLQPFFRSPIVGLGVHWVFQGMLYMDRTERMFKLGLDLILIAILWSLFFLVLEVSSAWAAVVAFLLAHTLNFLFNGQICLVLAKCEMVRHSRLDFDAYVRQFSERIRTEPSIEWAAAYGSLVRGEWTEYSDLDVRIVRRPGLWNGLRACWFTLRERTRALISRFPLDVFVLDDSMRLAMMRDNEHPQELVAPSAPAADKSR
jgi:predicted nucleotidyltransferase